MLLKRGSLIGELVEVPGHGALLKVAPEKANARLRSNAIHEVLVRFMEQLKPYVGLVIDLRGTEYSVSSADLATLMFAMMDHESNCFIPCSVLLDKTQAQRFQAMLDLTKLGFPELRIADSMDLAVRHATGSVDGYSKIPPPTE